MCILNDFCSEHLCDLVLDQLTALGTGSIWLLADYTCIHLKLDAMGDSFDFAEVSWPHLLVQFQHSKDLRSVCFVFDVAEVDHRAQIRRRFSFLCLYIDARVPR